MHPLRILLAGLLVVLMAAAGGLGQGGDAGPVRVVELDTDIDPVSARFVEGRIDAAEDDGAAVVVIRMDTPGGLVSSMRDIVADMQASDVPVAVWVGPSGARAGSAGAYISAASDHLGMAPGTNIGSATPISSGGEDLEEKVVNDAAASIAALAEEHGRNAAAFRAMVTEARNLTAQEALEQDVAETVQPSVEGFVAWLDGRPGRDGGVIRTAGAPIEVDELPWWMQVLQVLTDPTLVFFLLLLGIAGIGAEVFNPGAILPGVVGAISLLLALAGISVLPFTWAGIALICLAVILFIAETHVGGFGALGGGGVIALALGGAFLFDSDDPALEPTSWIVWLVAIVMGGLIALGAHYAWRARRRPSKTGGGELVGELGTARSAIGPASGQVLVNGEIWSARAADGTEIRAGEAVRVVTVHHEDLSLTVEPGEG